jgi:hypothetical protein
MNYRLYYGSNRKPVARVVPDNRYPGMWHIELPDGSIGGRAFHPQTLVDAYQRPSSPSASRFTANVFGFLDAGGGLLLRAKKNDFL